MPLYLEFYLWLVLISAVILTLERLFPRRKEQEILRPGFVQDLFWMVFNTQYLSWMLAVASVHLLGWLNRGFLHLGLPDPAALQLAASWPWWIQFVVFLVLKDFLEWNIHHLLHRVSWLWELHKLHHSVEHLDWATAFRSHWAEIILYKIVIYLPLVVLGVNEHVIFAILVFSVIVAELSHANLNWDWGPLGYLINSPKYHAWHHAVNMYGKGGQNFAVTLSIWDWIFGTAYSPKTPAAPDALGFEGSEDYPKDIWGRLWAPFRKHREKSRRP